MHELLRFTNGRIFHSFFSVFFFFYKTDGVHAIKQTNKETNYFNTVAYNHAAKGKVCVEV